MKKQWKRLAALSSAAVMAAGTLLYFPTDTLQNISWGITASAEETGEGTESGSQTWKEDNLTWTLTADGTMTISGSGAMKNYITDDSPATQKKDNVKKVVIEDGVTSIGDFAFFYCSSLTSIEIPSGVTSIGKNAFQYCSSLTSIEIPESVISIGNNTFEHCSSLTNITIPGSVTSIGMSAFSDCSSLASITIPESVTSIGNYAFYNCTGLTSITIPKSVTSIGNGMFKYCTGLTSITIPKSVTSIGSNVFGGCTVLTEVLLENGSTLTSGQLGVDASKIATYWNEDNLTWTLTADGTMTISGKGAMKEDYNTYYSPAYDNENIKKVVIEDGVTSIGEYAFSGCRSLTDITIPGSVTSIGDSAFEWCTGLTSIEIPEGVTSIGEFVFFSCYKLTEVFLENGSKLTSGNLGVDESIIGTYWNEGDLTWTLTADGTMTISGSGAMKDYSYDSPACDNSNIKKVVIEEDVTSIGDSAFSDCRSLTDITIPGSVTSIGNGAFSGCSSLTGITIPGSVTSIGNFAFYNCTGLTSISIPKSVTSIGTYTFSGCGNLTEITVPCDSTLTKDAFEDASEKVKYRHSLVKTDAKDATYTEAGNVEYWTCENCKKHFLSDETDAEAAKEVELSATVKPVLVQVATATTQIKCVYGQDMEEIDLQDYVKNADAVGGVSVKVATGSTMLDGMQLDGNKLSGKPAKAYTDSREVTFTFTAKNGNTADLTLNFLVAKADPTVKVTVDGDTHTEGDLVSELKLILSGNNTKGAAKIVSKLKKLIAGENTLTWEFTPEDSENYNVVTGTVVVNAQTTTTTTTTTTNETTSTTKATTATSGTTEETTTKNETTATTEGTTTTNETTATTEETTITNETTVTTEETTTNETTATTEAITATSETTATTEATTTTSETTATTEATTTTNETTATTEGTTTTNGTTTTTEETTTTSETSATTGETTTNETTVATKASTVTTNETIATTGTTSATKATTATTNGTTSATQTTTTTKESTTASETTMTTSASSTESTAATSATTITTATTTSVTNIADEDLCSWALNDYLKKTGVIAVNAEITARSENAYEITLTDLNGNVLDVYTVDPKTGTGTDSSNAEVNLPQTGNNSMTNWLLCMGAALFMAFGFGAVKASGIRKRKEDE